MDYIDENEPEQLVSPYLRRPLRDLGKAESDLRTARANLPASRKGPMSIRQMLREADHGHLTVVKADAE